MEITRRGFISSFAAGAAATLAVPFPLASRSGLTQVEPCTTDDRCILLYSNENAYGPSRKVLEVLNSSGAIVNRYPRLHYKALVERIATANRVKPEQVILGCGSTDILRMAACAFLGPGRALIQAAPTFEAIEHYARGTEADVVAVPLARDFSHNLDAMLEHVNGAASLVYVCNPNNPTATLTPRGDLETFISKLPRSTHVIIDEAYHHYAGRSGMYASFIDRPADNDQVIVVRTFSKVFGLAGLRLGYAVGSAKTIAQIRKFATEDSINALASAVVDLALDDTVAVGQSVQRNADDRQEFFNQAMGRALKPIDSHTNFVMMNAFHPAQDIIAHFRRNNILIGRHFPPLDTYIRVSLGRPEEMRAFWSTWDMLPYEKGTMRH